MLTKAIEIACQGHLDQFDKAGKPYILHPLRLMFKFSDEDLQIVAVLHDVIEDSELEIDNLKKFGFSEVITDAVAALTKQNGEEYTSFIQRVAKNKIARLVKIEDLKDNLDLCRLDKISDKDLSRVEKYHRALVYLKSLMS